jgi:hypothetical protein
MTRAVVFIIFIFPACRQPLLPSFHLLVKRFRKIRNLNQNYDEKSTGIIRVAVVAIAINGAVQSKRF